MTRKFCVFFKTDNGREIPLDRFPDGICSGPEGRVELHTERIGTVLALSIKGSLRTPGEHLAEDGALTVRFPEHRADFVADAMRGEFWCRPVFGNLFSQVPARTQALLWKEGAVWRLLWPLCGTMYNSVLEGSSEGLDLKLFSHADGLDEIPETPCLLYSSGKDPHTMLRRAAEAAERLLCGRVRTIDRKTFPRIFEYLGWCSWDALQIRVSEEGLLRKADEFCEKNIPVRWCIIDDMWGHVRGLNEVPPDIPFQDMVKIMHSSTLYAMEADPVRFPNGLAGCITALHRKGLQVGVWYPTTGYWKGLDPEGPAAKHLQKDLVCSPNGKLVAAPTKKSATRFHNAMQDMLKSAGADFVKVDNQSHYRNTYRHMVPIGEAASAVQGAIEQVTKSHFGDGLINCMGMSGEAMWNRAESAVARASDDFLPDNRPWFAKHLLQCSYNSLFQGQFFYSDWDMWWTDDGQAVKNSICRAISGGPVYVSDKIGRTQKKILMPLCFSDGKLLRADRQATPCADCLLQDPRKSEKPFKIFNRVAGCGVLAAFNLNEENQPQSGVISPADAGMRAGTYLVVEQITGENFILEQGRSFSLTLADNDAFRLYLFFPLTGKNFAVGLTEKFLSPAAILHRSKTGVRLYEGGKLGLYGVREIATNRRERVTGTPAGMLQIFDLAPDEIDITYLK